VSKYAGSRKEEELEEETAAEEVAVSDTIGAFFWQLARRRSERKRNGNITLIVDNKNQSDRRKVAHFRTNGSGLGSRIDRALSMKTA
jgi:hypothetical protein